MLKIVKVNNLYQEQAKLADIAVYCQQAKELAGEGNEVVQTGAAPVWLYLKIAHSLHGIARTLVYRSPVTGDVEIFNHNPK
ncbi:MAG: CRISPR-associated protein Csx3 [Nitrospirota bacterium]